MWCSLEGATLAEFGAALARLHSHFDPNEVLSQEGTTYNGLRPVV
jgi:hypothetical protein